MNDINPVKSEIVPDWTGLLIFLAIFGLFLWELILIVKWRKRKQEQLVEEVVAVEPKESVQEKTMRKLDELGGLIEKKQWEEYYLGVSEVVKEYASYLHQNDFMELTTREIIQQVDDDELVQLLKQLDGSKFAELGMDKESAAIVHESAREYIQR